MGKLFNKLNIFLLLILIYELSMIIFKLDGLSISKLVIVGFVWLSIGIAIHAFIKNYRKLKNNIPRFAFNILWILIIWNLINIGRGLYSDSGTITTLFGNVFTSLALLVPFVVVFSIKTINLKRINHYFFKLLKIGILLFILFFVLGGGVINFTQIRILNILFLPVIFLITTIHFEKKNKKYIVLIVAILLFYVAYINSSRTMIIRELLLIIGLISLFFYRKFHFKWILKVTFILLIVPFIFIQSSMDSGESFFQKNLSSVSDEEMSTDTRTFLYIEVYEDLVNNNKLLFGKGANGTYYSDYFNVAEGDSETRLSVEVGVLAILLKSGLVGVTLYLSLLFAAIYFSFFRSNNYFVVGVGFMLFIYTMLLFIENSISYSSHNLLVWFFIGVCLSNEIRNMSNFQIQNILNPKKYINEVSTIN